jgi:alpha-D-xyloside xylohydrolase
VVRATAGGIQIEIETDPLLLRLVGILEAPKFVAIGTTTRDPDLYVDAAAPKEVTFQIPARAIEWDGKKLTLEGGATLTPDLTLAKKGAALLRFVLPLDEDVYGLGELYDTPASRNVVREMQLRIDTTTEAGTNEVHLPVPLAILPQKQLGIFAAEKRPGAFDTSGDQLTITFATESLSLHLYSGDAIAILQSHFQEVGAPRVPPDWAFAPMQWRNEATQAEVLDDAMQIRANHLPGSTIWIDNPWQTGYQTFAFDPTQYPDPKSMIDQLGQLGFHLVLWSSPYLDAAPPTDGDHALAAMMNLLVTDGHGNPYDFPWQNGPGALMDFRAEGAKDFWRARVQKVIDLGVAGFKLDFGEDLVPEIGGRKSPFRLGSEAPDVWHAAYAGEYHQAYLADDRFLITRAGTAGTEQYTTCVWPGDLNTDFSRHTATHSGGLPAAVSAAVSLSASGFPYFASDIGGFRGGAPTTEALCRWIEAASVLPIMQLGGGGKSHNPWDTTLYGPEALPIYQKYARLHADLFPYFRSLEAPIARAPGLMNPGQAYEDSFFVGPALFAAPVVESSTSRTVTLPPGDWIDWWSGQLTSGAQTLTVPLDVLPLWRKVGEMVPLLANGAETFLPSLALDKLRVLLAPRGAAHFDLPDGKKLDVTDDLTLSTDAPDVEFDLDSLGFVPTGTALPMGDVASCAGCWSWDGRVLRVRIVGGGSVKVLR